MGTVVVAAISASVLGVAILLARPARASLDALGQPVLSSLRNALGLMPRSFGLVPDSQALVPPGVVARTTVAGRILDAEGNPVPGSSVRVRSEARPGWDWVMSTGSDGSFLVEGVAAGKIRVAAEDTATGFVESAMLNVDEARHVVLVLNRTVELTGVILDERSAPIARAAVKWWSKVAATERVVIADEDGRYAIRRAASSADRITVWARGFEATTVAFDAFAGDVIKRDVRLCAARPVRGFIVDPSGQAVSGARVSACPGKESEVATSDASGAFELPATVIGCWVAAYHPHFASARPTQISDRRKMVVRLGAGGAIEGTAVDEHGKPIGLFSVTIASFEPEDTVPGLATRAGETGNHLRGSFRLDDLAPGTYVLRLGAEGMVDTDSKPIEVSRGRVIRGEQLVLTASEVEDPAPPGEDAEPAAAGPETAETTAEGSAETPPDAPPEEKSVTSGGWRR